MKLIVNRPIYVKGAVLLEGHAFETNEQHGRELLARGYASQKEEKQDEQKAEDQKPARASRNKPEEAK